MDLAMNAKRLFDVVVGGVALCVSSPVLLGLAAAIKLEDGGPIFYRGERIGRRGQPFRIYKFRSMVVDAEKLGADSTSADDARVTRVGRCIRRFKFDELAQFINVVLGDMSIVGPRPEVKKFVDLYTEEEKQILELRPGITDWASIWNHDEGAAIAASGIVDADEAYARVIRPTKLRLQLKYANERSLLTDVRIILRTARAVLEKDHDVSDIAPPPGRSEAKDAAAG